MEAKAGLLEWDGEAAQYRHEYGVMPASGKGVLGFRSRALQAGKGFWVLGVGLFSCVRLGGGLHDFRTRKLEHKNLQHGALLIQKSRIKLRGGARTW